MTITVIRRSDICRNVPKRWAEQYKGYGYDKGETAEKLNALAPEELTKDRIDAIIGNTSWTRNECGECHLDHEATVRIGDEPDYDAHWLDLCAGCLERAARLAKEQTASETGKFEQAFEK